MPQLRRVPSLESVMTKNWLIRYLGGTLRQSAWPERKEEKRSFTNLVTCVISDRYDASVKEKNCLDAGRCQRCQNG